MSPVKSLSLALLWRKDCGWSCPAQCAPTRLGRLNLKHLENNPMGSLTASLRQMTADVDHEQLAKPTNYSINTWCKSMNLPASTLFHLSTELNPEAGTSSLAHHSASGLQGHRGHLSIQRSSRKKKKLRRVRRAALHVLTGQELMDSNP